MWVSNDNFRTSCMEFVQTVISKFWDNIKESKCLIATKTWHYEFKGSFWEFNFHIEHYRNNLWDFSEEQDERFHQNPEDVDRKYPGHWGVNMMTAYYWIIFRKSKQESHLLSPNFFHFNSCATFLNCSGLKSKRNVCLFLVNPITDTFSSYFNLPKKNTNRNSVL